MAGIEPGGADRRVSASSFAIGLCIMFFPTMVLGTINAVMSPCGERYALHAQRQVFDLNKLQQQRPQLEREAMSVISKPLTS